MKLPEPPRFTRWDVSPFSTNGIGTLTHVSLQLVDVDSGRHVDFTPIRHVLVNVNNLHLIFICFFIHFYYGLEYSDSSIYSIIRVSLQHYLLLWHFFVYAKIFLLL